MQAITENLKVRDDSDDKYCRGECQNNHHVEEHSEGLRGRVRREAEREHVSEGHNTEGEEQEDHDSCRIVEVERQEEDDCCSYRDVEFQRIKDEVSDPVRAKPHASNDLNMLELGNPFHDKVADRESDND